jgi:hypothetical protein
MRNPGKLMNFLRFLIVPILSAALLLTGSQVYSVAATAVQKERSAHSKKLTKFQYVCPMHETVTSKKRGFCPKCKMELVKKPVPQETAQ